MILFIIDLSLSFKYVVLKIPVFDSAIRKCHYASSVLDTLFPFSFIDGAIGPVHLTIAVALIIHVVSIVYVTTLPSEDALTVLLVHLVHTLESVAFGLIANFPPFAFSLFHAVFEFSDICTTVLPFIVSVAIWFSESVVTSVYIAVCENICSFTMFQAVDPAAFVTIAVFPLMYNVNIGLTVLTLS